MRILILSLTLLLLDRGRCDFSFDLNSLDRFALLLILQFTLSFAMCCWMAQNKHVLFCIKSADRDYLIFWCRFYLLASHFKEVFGRSLYSWYKKYKVVDLFIVLWNDLFVKSWQKSDQANFSVRVFPPVFENFKVLTSHRPWNHVHKVQSIIMLRWVGQLGICPQCS